ncbi:GNAT family N-acetyltransferase [Nesterenkonia sp. CF4.4]|uniref:GNAT family N-acetyltransferase n=1 Tax=Nesterenkonia sp. CF4.4 TaxID=3373079 RepID=UPI003EE759BE
MVEILKYTSQHRDAVLALSLRAWDPVFPLMRESVSPFVYENFYPHGWRERQSEDLAAVLDGEPENVAVAVDGPTTVGWVCTRLHAQDQMSEIYVLAVDPAFQGRGIARALMEHSFDQGRAAGMRMVLVETGGDPGHEPARLAYEAVGFQRWPVARYFKDLSS